MLTDGNLAVHYWQGCVSEQKGYWQITYQIPQLINKKYVLVVGFTKTIIIVNYCYPICAYDIREQEKPLQTNNERKPASVRVSKSEHFIVEKEVKGDKSINLPNSV